MTDWLGIAAIISQVGFAGAAYKLAAKHDKDIVVLKKRQDDHEADNQRHVKADK